ncbi:hypothetical protein [Dactylosporangium sp. CA-139066]|uniref:hypothetical protein n=1 Tax=Dactylosporangium sp. CA-139066 TaxID=3239930 RepID=UPI003D8F0219
MRRAYSSWFYLPAALVYGTLFLVPHVRVVLLQLRPVAITTVVVQSVAVFNGAESEVTPWRPPCP